jgi:hypothetical protein
MNKKRVDKLIDLMNKKLSSDKEANEKYIAFLKLHNLPNSGPTAKLLDSIPLDLRFEFCKIFA